MLMNETTQSQAEYTGQILRAASGAIFVGSPTAGACGDVTRFGLPSGITVSFTGQNWQWPDGKRLQRVGLIPDVYARPTKAGLAAGREEVLEAALAYLYGVTN
jgi:C-terminal processing protease CtpA/Prc